MTSPAKKKTAVGDAMVKHHISERRACRALNINRSGLRYDPVILPEDSELTARIIELATNYGRYGYRKITRMVNDLGYHVNHKKVERIWREQGLRVPKRQHKKRRLFLNDGSCIRLRAEHKNHVWSYDFVYDELSNHKIIRWLNIIDEYTRECLFTMPARTWRNGMIIEVLSGLFIKHGAPEYIRSDNGPEFVAKKLKEWIHSIGVQTAYIEPGSPWENGYCESFNSKMRDEFLNETIFDTLKEARLLTKEWMQEYNTIRPHGSIGYKTPAAYQVVVA